MPRIRPISDLRNRFSEISDFVQGGKTVILTKNGYGYMVAMSFDAYKSWADPVVSELNRADDLCETDDRHYTREESLKILKDRANGDSWNNIVVAFNSRKEPAKVSVPKGSYTIVCKDGKINPKGMGRMNGTEVMVPAQSALIMHQ